MANGAKSGAGKTAGAIPLICSICTFFVRTDSYNHPEDTDQVASTMQVGNCRRHSPQSGIGWPIVKGSNWCGDHKLDHEKLKHGARTSF